jgi:hypothetical protein
MRVVVRTETMPCTSSTDMGTAIKKCFLEYIDLIK